MTAAGSTKGLNCLVDDQALGEVGSRDHRCDGSYRIRRPLRTGTDHALGGIVNHNLAEYHVPVNADVGEIDVIFVEEQDSIVNPLGVKGVGEIGVVGTAAAIANAVYHATGVRVRDLPITLDKIVANRRERSSIPRSERTPPACSCS